MIITITGKPCSGKGIVSKLFCKKYNFKYICTGDMFREYSKQFGCDNIGDFQQDKRIKEIDKLIDTQIYELGKTSLNENIVIDSRLAWHFIPNSFKVFIDITDKIAGERLLNAKRETEQVKNIDDAIKVLKVRWKDENDRYQELYNTNNLNLKNYDMVISSDNLTPEEIVNKIHEKYQRFLRNI